MDVLGPRLTFASALSLLLCIAMLALWVWSQAPHRNELRIRCFGTQYALASDRGELLVDNSPEIEDQVRQRSDAADGIQEREEIYKATGQWPGSVREFKQLQADSRRDFPAAMRYTVPDWGIALLALLLPILWARKWAGQRRLVTVGLCPQCGYDLRASKDRCPECGTPIPTTALRGDKSPASNWRAARL